MLKVVLFLVIIESIFSLIVGVCVILELKIVIGFRNFYILFFFCNRKLYVDLKIIKVEEMKV